MMLVNSTLASKNDLRTEFQRLVVLLAGGMAILSALLVAVVAFVPSVANFTLVVLLALGVAIYVATAQLARSNRLIVALAFQHLLACVVLLRMIALIGSIGAMVIREAAIAMNKAREDADQAAVEREKTNDELRRALVAAANANMIKSQFVSSISHELRTPLTLILGYTELLNRLIIVSDHKEYIETVETIHSNSRHLLHLVNNLLDFGKLEHSGWALSTDRVVLSELIADVSEVFVTAAHQKGLTFTSYIDSMLPPAVEIDRRALRLILSHLLSNAVRYTPAGGVGLFVRSASLAHFTAPSKSNTAAPDSPWILFEVSDTGIGIPDEKVTRAFEPFDKVDTSNTRRYGGVGIGLATVQRLVELLGGTVELTSRVQKGTRVVIGLPLVASNAEVQDSSPMQVWSSEYDQPQIEMLVAQ